MDVFQPCSGADNADIPPHQILNFADNFFSGGVDRAVGIRARLGLTVFAGELPNSFAHGLAGSRAENQSFKQGIAGQAIGAMHAGGGCFAGGIQAGQGAAARRDRCARRPWHSARRGGWESCRW